jgi:hypothetical protein
MLPPETYLRYTRAIGIAQPRLENRATSAMPQMFADRFGWPEMVEAVARVYTGGSLIVLGDRQEVLEAEFEDVQKILATVHRSWLFSYGASVGCPAAMPQERWRGR